MYLLGFMVILEELRNPKSKKSRPRPSTTLRIKTINDHEATFGWGARPPESNLRAHCLDAV